MKTWLKEFLIGVVLIAVNIMTAEKKFAATESAGLISSDKTTRKRKEEVMETEMMNIVWADFFQTIELPSKIPLACPNCGEPVKLSGKRKANWVIKDGKDKYICVDRCKKLKDH